jgi:hypothetical protein
LDVDVMSLHCAGCAECGEHIYVSFMHHVQWYLVYHS